MSNEMVFNKFEAWLRGKKGDLYLNEPMIKHRVKNLEQLVNWELESHPAFKVCVKQKFGND